MPRERAHRIFAELAADLAAVIPGTSNAMLCPLCLRPYPEEAIDGEDPELTEEHIIPENLGGKLVTLSCKPCNNIQGSYIDSHLIQKIRSSDSLSGLGGRTLKGQIGIGANLLPVRFNAGERTFSVRNCKPSVLDEVRTTLQERRVESVPFQLRLGYIPVRAWLGLLRAAHLAVFRELGYRYILSPPAGVIREIISHPEDAPAELGQIVGEIKPTSRLPREPLHIVSLPDAGVLLVVLTLTAERKRYFSAILPDPRMSPENLLGGLCNAVRMLRAI